MNAFDIAEDALLEASRNERAAIVERDRVLIELYEVWEAEQEETE
jgi:hypothetical protein